MNRRIKIVVADRAGRLRDKARQFSQRRVEQRWEHWGVLRELADLAVRTARRRRTGDGSIDRS